MGRAFRVGDTVRIVRPRFIKRVGYPLTFVDLREEFADHPQFTEAMRLLGFTDGAHEVPFRVKREIVDGLARGAVRARGWGGKERRIHYEDQPRDLTDYLTTVLAKRVRMTGDYYPPSGGQDMTGEDWYEPGGLTNQRSHVILTTGYGDIEACDVELVEPEQ